MDIATRLNEAKLSLDDAKLSINEALRLVAAANQPTISIRQGDNLLDALAQAAAGTVVIIDPLFSANLDRWSITKPLTLVNRVDPGPERITPKAALPTLRGMLSIEAPDVTLRAVACVGPDPNGTLISTYAGTVLDRVVALGSPDGQHRGIAMNARHVGVSRCHIANIWKDQDTQAIGGWMNAQYQVIDDSFLEASGENMCYGGADAPDEASMPMDITVTGCTLSKPMTWRGKPNLTAKNLLELKNVRRFTMKRCVLENSWANGQEGYAVLLHVRNQDGGNPWATIEDVLLEDVTCRHLGGGISLLGHDEPSPQNPSGASGSMANVTLRRIVFEDIDPVKYGGSGRQLIIQNGAKNLSVDECRWSGANLNTLIALGLPGRSLVGFSYTNNSAMEGEYGIHGAGSPGLGKLALDFYAPAGYTWTNNTVMLQRKPSDPVTYPDGTKLVL